MSAVEQAAARVAEFVRQRRVQVGLDPDLITSFWSDVNAQPAELRLSDLDLIAAAIIADPGT